MSAESKPEAAAEARNEYAYWVPPGGATTVTYSLPLFHEIDFTVNEGFRKIPHGGIEEGGLLFGKIDKKETRIEAFRAIQCEHASGPSFLLSDADLELLTAQLQNAAGDAELASLQPVGWFLAHTRGPLVLTDREAELFDRFFPTPGMLTVLVKPERFQPTRFGFLPRGKEKTLARDAAQNAIILPLPGRGARASSGPVASIPAPAATTVAKRAVEATTVKPPVQAPPAGAPGGAEPAPQAADERGEQRGGKRNKRLNLEQVQHSEESGPPSPAPAAGAGELEPIRLSSLDAGKGAVALRTAPDSDSQLDPYRQIELINQVSQKKPAGTTARLVMVLPLAALFGCIVGYIAYLQVPSPVIPLEVKGRGQTVIVTWPAEQTKSAVYAAVRVDDSTPVMLTPEERSTGRVEVTASADMKVELIARNWIHDSRGIVRFVKPLANTAP